MEYLIRLVQSHETFRKPELQALAHSAHVKLEILSYSEYSPYCIVRLASEAAARALVARSILSKGIFELWGSGSTYEALHADIKRRTSSQWPRYRACSFKFSLDHFQGRRSSPDARRIIETFDYLGFKGPIKMRHPEQDFHIFEEFALEAAGPKAVHLGRWIAAGDRDAIVEFSLKTRKYISTTSMDSELALITANLACAAPGKLFYDPFVGTGSFPIACAHFGAMTLGSDIDGRSIRGSKGRNVKSSFGQYGLEGRWMGGFVSDLTHSPLRKARILDGILCDPPYGVREGLKVLGRRDGAHLGPVMIDGKPAHVQEGYVPPKRPYSFEAMLDDILAFAATTLVDDGMLSLWMPTANEEEVELGKPTNPHMRIESVCTQIFNKWSRRLLTYRRLPECEVNGAESSKTRDVKGEGKTADDLNSFRRKYFQGFRPQATPEP